jgi:hypothetical protein
VSRWSASASGAWRLGLVADNFRARPHLVAFSPSTDLLPDPGAKLAQQRDPSQKSSIR